MLSVVKMPLKAEVEGCALNSDGNYIVDHVKSMELCFLISVGTLKIENFGKNVVKYFDLCSNFT